MPLVLSAALFALGAWAAALALVALLDRLRPAAFSWAFSGASLGLVAALVGLALLRGDASPGATQAAAACAVAAWAWQEAACAPRGRRRGGFALGTSLAQELTWLPFVAGGLALSWGGANLAARWMLPALWLLHLCMRLNALCAERASAHGPLLRPPWFAAGLPAAQLLSGVFPLTVTALTMAAALAFEAALAPGADAGSRVALASIGAALAAGTAAHWTLVVHAPAWRRVELRKPAWDAAPPAPAGEAAGG